MKTALKASIIFLVLTFINLGIIFSNQHPFDNLEWLRQPTIVVPIGISILLYLFAAYQYSKNLFIKTTFGFILYSLKAVVSPIFFTVIFFPSQSSLLLKILFMQIIPLVLADLWYLREMKKNEAI